MTSQITITYQGTKKKYPAETPLSLLAKEHQKEYKAKILLAYQDGNLRELFHTVDRDSEIRFSTVGDSVGASAYLRSLIFLMGKAIHDICPDWYPKFFVHYMIGNGLYCSVRGHKLTRKETEAIEDRMRVLVKKNIPFKKESVNRQEAIRLFQKIGLSDKAKLFQYRRSSQVNIYKLGDCYNYFYSYLVPSTGYLDLFELVPYHGGILLQRPSSKDVTRVLPYKEQKMLFQTMQKSEEFGDKLNLLCVGDLNGTIVREETKNLILLQEAKMEKTIGDIAEAILKAGKRVVLIAGPSSSGKTTFANRLAIQLKALGLNPKPLSCDDYFKPRVEYPKDADGKYDFESIDCVRIDDLNADVSALLRGKTVSLPTYDFIEGKPNYTGKTLTLEKGDILILEGIHCLNDRFMYAVDPSDKYKIYISALTQLNIDEHNYIPTTDGRLIRRIIRDNATRGYSAEKTILQWPSVGKGEEKNIFPYQENADTMVNSALIYELSVLKPYAEPLLFGVPKESPAYIEAQRLLKFFDYFLTIPSEDIPKNSLIREFIGGSAF